MKILLWRIISSSFFFSFNKVSILLFILKKSNISKVGFIHFLIWAYLLQFLYEDYICKYFVIFKNKWVVLKHLSQRLYSQLMQQHSSLTLPFPEPSVLWWCSSIPNSTCHYYSLMSTDSAAARLPHPVTTTNFCPQMVQQVSALIILSSDVQQHPLTLPLPWSSVHRRCSSMHPSPCCWSTRSGVQWVVNAVLYSGSALTLPQVILLPLCSTSGKRLVEWCKILKATTFF